MVYWFSPSRRDWNAPRGNRGWWEGEVLTNNGRCGLNTARPQTLKTLHKKKKKKKQQRTINLSTSAGDHLSAAAAPDGSECADSRCSIFSPPCPCGETSGRTFWRWVCAEIEKEKKKGREKKLSAWAGMLICAGISSHESKIIVSTVHRLKLHCGYSLWHYWCY